MNLKSHQEAFEDRKKELDELKMERTAIEGSVDALVSDLEDYLELVLKKPNPAQGGDYGEAFVHGYAYALKCLLSHLHDQNDAQMKKYHEFAHWAELVGTDIYNGDED